MCHTTIQRNLQGFDVKSQNSVEAVLILVQSPVMRFLKTTGAEHKTMPNQTSLELIEQDANNDKIYKEDAERLKRFVSYYSTVKKLHERTTKKYYYSLHNFLKQLRQQETKLHELDEEQTLKLIDFLNNSDWSEHTRLGYWDRFTRFYGWLADRAEEDGEEWNKKAYRLLVDTRHKVTYKLDKNNIIEKGTLTFAEVQKLVEKEPHDCYKTFFSVLYESGMRSEEALTLQIRDAQRNKQTKRYKLQLRKSKTVKRPIPLDTWSSDYLYKWLAKRKGAGEEEPLFLNSAGNNLINETANKELRKLLEITGITRKKITLHSFRHSRATHLANQGWTEAELCRFFGWNIGSKMPGTYIRESGIDVERALRRMNGEEEQQERTEPVRTCLQCDHKNTIDAENCDLCKMPLNPERLSNIKDVLRNEKEYTLAYKLFERQREDVINEILERLRVRD